MSPLFALHCATTWALVGLIWTVQLVHYPLFDRVERARFSEFERDHSMRISRIAAPLMLFEAVSGAVLVLVAPTGLESARLWLSVGLALIVLIWLSTFLLQVPRHRELARGFDAEAHGALVRSNWIRTVAWTARGALLAWLALGTA
ncbi:MAG: hypothetical protein U0527_02105 [Candidatus Eisenbacteria bacterium]